MRKWAYLKKPYICNKKDVAYKVMIYETATEGTFVFLYCSKDAMRKFEILKDGKWIEYHST